MSSECLWFQKDHCPTKPAKERSINFYTLSTPSIVPHTHRHHLGVYQNCRILGFTSSLWIRICTLNKIPEYFILHIISVIILEKWLHFFWISRSSTVKWERKLSFFNISSKLLEYESWQTMASGPNLAGKVRQFLHF